jgi:hypothetical protein
MQRVAAYRHFEKPTPKGRSSALVAASQPDSWKLRSFWKSSRPRPSSSTRSTCAVAS